MIAICKMKIFVNEILWWLKRRNGGGELSMAFIEGERDVNGLYKTKEERLW